MSRQDPVVGASKLLSLILRHRPDQYNLKLDAGGWVAIDDILNAVSWLNRTLLDRAVAENNKRRFSISEDGLRIRANQGHSIEVDLDLKPCAPPAVLFHGTADKVVGVIQREGILKMNRQHVHLSADRDTAANVGRRRASP